MKLVSAVLNLLQILRCNISRHGRAHPLARCYKSEIGRYVLLGRHSSLVYGSIGDYSYIGSNSNLNHARIGKYTSIAQNVRIAGGTHPTGQFVSTHPLTYAARPYCGRQYVQVSTYDDMGWLDPERQIAVDIGNDVWIGADVLIIPGTAGIRIGDGAIIGGGAVVTRDIPPYAIAVGVPARVKKYRFTEAQIAQLEALRWWDRPDDWVRQHIADFDDIDKFLDHRKE